MTNKINKRFGNKKNSKDNDLAEGVKVCNELLNIEALNIQERNNRFLSIIMQHVGLSLSVNSVGLSFFDNNETYYTQKTEIKNTEDSQVIAFCEMTESKDILLAGCDYLKLPKIPSLVLENLCLAKTLGYIGVYKSSATHIPTNVIETEISSLPIATSDTQPKQEENLPPTLVEKVEVVKLAEDESVSSATPDKEPVSEPSLELVDNNKKTDDSFVEQNDSELDASNLQKTVNDNILDIPHDEAKDNIVVVSPASSSHKKIDKEPLAASSDIPEKHIISQSSIRKFFSAMQQLDIGEDAVLSFLNVKESAGETQPLSIGEMTKGQGYRVLNRLKKAIEKSDPAMENLINARREKFGGFNQVIEKANSAVAGEQPKAVVEKDAGNVASNQTKKRASKRQGKGKDDLLKTKKAQLISLITKNFDTQEKIDRLIELAHDKVDIRNVSSKESLLLNIERMASSAKVGLLHQLAGTILL
ncbi:hypothetical protein [Photobacterium kishitanii]|uniref:Uncharacterized protein n=1 Tax=Photobacterium kishitanii TaxID=318456 RepID=A0A2T3KMW5_9GAMM|nr:hypothetical protein [Photobacterium kishitanii]PSV01143.1 hypothetical protein C9J27_03730 [Photobacterium kishitanii]